MTDHLFFDNFGPFSIEELARISNSEFFKPDNYAGRLTSHSLIEGVAPLDIASPTQLAVLHNVKYAKILQTSRAGICIAEERCKSLVPPHIALLVNKNPYKAYALIASAFYPEEVIAEYISEDANIDQTAIIGLGCAIGNGVSIGQGAVIGEGCRIGANTVIGRSVKIGNNCNIGPNISISHAIIGHDVIIHAGVRIGQDGFGFASDEKGHYKIPQLGRVLIGDKVEIGANSCIDRGSGHDTIIGDQCKIDNLVQIGHNVHLGRGCILVAQVGISGSTKIGDFVVIGGQAGVAGHLNIGSGAQIAAKSGVIKDIPPQKIYGGYPAVPIKTWHRQTIAIKKLSKTNEDLSDE